MKLKFLAARAGDRVYFYIRKHQRKHFPAFFEVEVETSNIKLRQKNGVCA